MADDHRGAQGAARAGAEMNHECKLCGMAILDCDRLRLKGIAVDYHLECLIRRAADLRAALTALPSPPTCPHCGVPLTGMNSNPDECLHKPAPVKDAPPSEDSREGRLTEFFTEDGVNLPQAVKDAPPSADRQETPEKMKQYGHCIHSVVSGDWCVECRGYVGGRFIPPWGRRRGSAEMNGDVAAAIYFSLGGLAIMLGVVSHTLEKIVQELRKLREVERQKGPK